MRVASEARAKLDKMLQDSGLMTKVPEQLALETEIPFEDPEVRKAYLGFLKLARERGEKNLGIIITGMVRRYCEKKPAKNIVTIVALNRIENMGFAPLLVKCSPKMPENDQNRG